jgi:ankyrin repeat protein
MKPPDRPILYTLFGLNRGGRILYGVLFAAAIPALTLWAVFLPRLRFGEEEERLFRAARHGDVAGVERSLSAGAKVNAVSPVDGKSALFRAAVFGYADVVRALLEHGADAAARGSDGRTALDVALAARAAQHDSSRTHALDAVVTALGEGGSTR